MKLLKKLLLIGQLFVSASIIAQTTPELPSIQKFVKSNASKYTGVFNVYLQDDKYYLEVPDSLLNRDILAMIVINKGSAQVSRDPSKRFGFAGDVVHEAVFKFNKGFKETLNMEQAQFYIEPTRQSAYEATLKNKLASIVVAFNPVAKNAKAVLIDITNTLNSDMPFLSLSGAKDELSLGPYQSNLSRPTGIAGFANSLVFRSIRAYGAGAVTPKPNAMGSPAEGSDQGNTLQMTGPTSWEVGASWYLLPAKPMRLRFADKRVGYFARAIRDYAQNPNNIEDRNYATRWKIEPKPQDIDKFNRGELVEPASPIVYYIDKNTPAYLRPYFIAGVNAWQKTFERIGFKNAIVAKMEPTQEENPDFSIDNPAYSVISYKPSTTANAYGPMVIDPRSGQILSSHVAVFHNITDLLQRWYFVNCAANDPAARKLPLSEEIMGRMAQMVITHEVGHTLGLRHDFAGSHSYDVDSVRKRSFVAKNGFGASIMDYLRFNYVAQPEDGFKAEELLPKIGVYDDFAIEWGYKIFPKHQNAEQDAEVLKRWVSKMRKDPRFLYFPEGDFFDPRIQSEDMGSNAMKAGTLAIKNLKVMMQNLAVWLEDNDDDNYTMMKRMHSAVASRYNEYLAHVLKNIGGRYADNALTEERRSNYVPVSRDLQKEAMAFINDYYFNEPQWLFPKEITDKTRFTFSGEVSADYEAFLGRVFYKFSAIGRNQRILGEQRYTVSEFFDDMYKGLFSDLNTAEAISAYRRMLQQRYVNLLLTAVYNPASYENDVAILLKQQIDKVAAACEVSLKVKTDKNAREHLNAIADMISQWKGKKLTK